MSKMLDGFYISVGFLASAHVFLKLISKFDISFRTRGEQLAQNPNVEGQIANSKRRETDFEKE
jgi:hypothetical protein